MYQLTNDENAVLRLDDGARIPNGHRWWDDYQEWLGAGNVPEPVPKTDYAPVIAARRYEAETAGIVFGGAQIDTGRDSQALITGAALNAVIDPSYTCNWKTPSGFVQLDAQTLLGVATTLRAHVQACFDREAELLAALNAGEFTAEMLEEGWPNESVPTTPAG
ncbi:DUF4376 domain-containing protein [Pseudomonas kuykendallii]|uniref:DUF4376 domain-containing protein n=1 Tax=Pseudomonas kuykendallii TaxID=1007099 RepID=UPI0028D05440|nr:DUF4376 domain-containing protein [Pseudomonas kuykendallii]